MSVYFNHLEVVLRKKLANGEFNVDFSSAEKTDDIEYGSNYAHTSTEYYPQWRVKKPDGYKSIADYICEIIELAERNGSERADLAWLFNKLCRTSNMFEKVFSYLSYYWDGCMGVSRTYTFIDGSQLEYSSWEGSETRLNQPWVLNRGDYLYTDREP